MGKEYSCQQMVLKHLAVHMQNTKSDTYAKRNSKRLGAHDINLSNSQRNIQAEIYLILGLVTGVSIQHWKQDRQTNILPRYTLSGC